MKPFREHRHKAFGNFDLNGPRYRSPSFTIQIFRFRQQSFQSIAKVYSTLLFLQVFLSMLSTKVDRDATLRIGNGWTCCNKKLFTRNSMEPRWRFYEPLQPLLSHEIRKMSKTSASSTARYKETEASLHYSKLSTTPHCLPFPDSLMKKISSSRPNYSR